MEQIILSKMTLIWAKSGQRLQRYKSLKINCFCDQSCMKIFFKPWHLSSKFNTVAHGLIQAVRAKTAGLHMALRGNFSSPVSATDPVKSPKWLGKSCTLHSKKNFGLGGVDFCEWRHKWRTLRTPCPTSPSPGPKQLDCSISLKFLLETRLQSESFDTLDDLLGFQVQKLWSKIIKIFD